MITIPQRYRQTDGQTGAKIYKRTVTNERRIQIKSNQIKFIKSRTFWEFLRRDSPIQLL